jgi:hypothetical protein
MEEEEEERGGRQLEHTRKHPNVRLYALTIHCCLEAGMPKCSPIVGSMMTEACTPSVFTNCQLQLDILPSGRNI